MAGPHPRPLSTAWRAERNRLSRKHAPLSNGAGGFARVRSGLRPGPCEMTLAEMWRNWRQDRLIGRVIRNTGYLFSSNTIGMVIGSLSGLLVPLLLSPAEYGTLGMVILFASTVNRLFSFRMGELVVKYAGEFLALGEKGRAAAVIKAAALAETLTSAAAYALLVVTAPLAAQFIIKDPAVTGLIVFYGAALLANFVTETATAALQIGGHFRSLAALNLGQSAATALLIGAAFVTHAGLPFLISAYLAGKLVLGLGTAATAVYHARSLLGPGWLRAPLALIPDRRRLARFAFSTNISGTINMVIRDSEVLWVGYFLSAAQAGYYKFALAIMNLVVMPITPFIATTFPEISKSVARREWRPLSTLLKRTSLLALVYTAAAAGGFALLGRWFFGVYSAGKYLPALPAILVLLLGYGFANVFFWNRPLLLAFGRPNEPLFITAAAGAVKTALMFVLVRPFGYLAQAALLSGYFIISIGAIVLRGLKVLRRAEQSSPTETEPA